jgi:hypothetical protein
MHSVPVTNIKLCSSVGIDDCHRPHACNFRVLWIKTYDGSYSASLKNTTRLILYSQIFWAVWKMCCNFHLLWLPPLVQSELHGKICLYLEAEGDKHTDFWLRDHLVSRSICVPEFISAKSLLRGLFIKVLLLVRSQLLWEYFLWSFSVAWMKNRLA